MVHILYLYSSFISSQENLSKVSACISIEPPSSKAWVSTLIDFPSTSSSYTILDDMYVKLISHDYATGTAAASCSKYSSHRPIRHSNEGIMEAMITRDYPWEDMHHHVYFLLYFECNTLNKSSMPRAYWGAYRHLLLLIILWRISCEVGPRCLNPFFEHSKHNGAPQTPPARGNHSHLFIRDQYPMIASMMVFFAIFSIY